MSEENHKPVSKTARSCLSIFLAVLFFIISWFIFVAFRDTYCSTKGDLQEHLGLFLTLLLLLLGSPAIGVMVGHKLTSNKSKPVKHKTKNEDQNNNLEQKQVGSNKQSSSNGSIRKFLTAIVISAFILILYAIIMVMMFYVLGYVLDFLGNHEYLGVNKYRYGDGFVMGYVMISVLIGANLFFITPVIIYRRLTKREKVQINLNAKSCQFKHIRLRSPVAQDESCSCERIQLDPPNSHFAESDPFKRIRLVPPNEDD